VGWVSIGYTVKLSPNKLSNPLEILLKRCCGIFKNCLIEFFFTVLTAWLLTCLAAYLPGCLPAWLLTCLAACPTGWLAGVAGLTDAFRLA